jgi:hypothetical protein
MKRLSALLLLWFFAINAALAGAGPGFSGGTPTLSSLGGAASGANSDITSLSGLTTPLSKAQGGTASATGVGLLPDGTTFAANKRQMSQVVATTAATAFTGIGSAAPTHVGTTAANATGSDGVWISSTSGAVSTNRFGWTMFSSATRGDHASDTTFYIKTGPDISALRIAVGLSSNVGVVDTDAPGAAGYHGAALVYSPPTTDTTAFWRTLTFNGASQTRFPTTQSIAVSTAYTIRIVHVPGVRDDFYINGTLVKSETATVTNNSAVLNVYVAGVTNEAVAKRIDAKKVVTEAD